MAPIDDVTAAIEARDHEERFVLQEYADRFGVVRSTLSRRLARQTSSVSAKATG
jgi:AraC-like DNA-binding protein